MSKAARNLAELVAWTRDKLERLHARTEDDFVRRNLHAIIRSLDPETNPRLEAAIAELGSARTEPRRPGALNP